MVTIGIDLASSRQAIELAGREPGVYATVGLHPHDAHLLDDAYLGELEELARAAARRRRRRGRPGLLPRPLSARRAARRVQRPDRARAARGAAARGPRARGRRRGDGAAGRRGRRPHGGHALLLAAASTWTSATSAATTRASPATSRTRTPPSCARRPRGCATTGCSWRRTRRSWRRCPTAATATCRRGSRTPRRWSPRCAACPPTTSPRSPRPTRAASSGSRRRG